MAVIYSDYGIDKPVLAALSKAGIPVTYQDDITFAEREDTVKFLTMHSCKGLEFPLVAIPGLGEWRMKGGRMRRQGCCMWR
jgi:superfamily I DNA/RNA helicase